MFAKDSLILAKNQLRLSSPLGLFISYNYRRGCDACTLKKDGSSKSGSLWGTITEVMTYNTSHTRIRQVKCSES
jgi:hypothetical protein